jgi:hypothetical protein
VPRAMRRSLRYVKQASLRLRDCRTTLAGPN